MNYNSDHPRLNLPVGFCELISHGDRIQKLQTTACQKQVNAMSGAYTVAVQMRNIGEK